MNRPLVTVVIPAYKCENFISSAIDSVLAQSYRNFELIVVDDGSPDKTADVITKYKDRLRYVHQANGGVSKARNTGIRNANGEYVAFLDADDRWDKNKLEIQMEVIERHPEIEMVCSAFRNTLNGDVVRGEAYKYIFTFFNEYEYGFNKIFNNESTLEHADENIKYYWGNIYDYLFLGNFILPSTVIARKEPIIRSGLFNENLRVSEETEFFLKFSKSNIIGFVDHPLACYEMPKSDNLSGKSNLERLIKNAIRIQINSIASDQKRIFQKQLHYFKGIGTSYTRLAYFYISEYKRREARRYASYGIKTYRFNPMSYMIYIISYLPENMIALIHNVKKYLPKNNA